MAEGFVSKQSDILSWIHSVEAASPDPPGRCVLSRPRPTSMGSQHPSHTLIIDSRVVLLFYYLCFTTVFVPALYYTSVG